MNCFAVKMMTVQSSETPVSIFTSRHGVTYQKLFVRYPLFHECRRVAEKYK
jgi:hypothetical protein